MSECENTKLLQIVSNMTEDEQIAIIKEFSDSVLWSELKRRFTNMSDKINALNELINKI